MRDLHKQLMSYGLHLMQEVTGIDPDAPRAGPRWSKPFEALLGTQWPDPEPVLTCIFSRVQLREQDQEDTRKAEAVYMRPAELEMKAETLFPSPDLPDDPAAAKSSVGQQFQDAYAGLQQKVAEDDPCLFTAFYHLLERFAWALPNTYGEPGVSLFQQWKAVAALVFASGSTGRPAKEFTLIGGDIPGIQRMIYTITSKGAAKALRGRSLFIQLLGDAVVRRLVHELGLCQANVIYSAGGNFMLLASEAQDTQDVLSQVNDDVNRALLRTYDGDIALCLASVEMPAEAVGTAKFGKEYSLKLKRVIDGQKARRFADIANASHGWAAVFEPRGGGGEQAHFCAVCQAELSKEELADARLLLVDVGELEPGETAPRACSDCATFRELAEAVGRQRLALYVRHDDTEAGKDRWQHLLHKLSGGWRYRFADWTIKAEAGETKYIVNDTDFVARDGHGFVLLANTTPRATWEDKAWWDETYPDQEGQVEPGSIRSFELLAHAAKTDGALERVGVLRMDVDSLGRVMTRGLFFADKPHRSMAATSALSAALDRFFAGYLDVLCRQVTAKPEMAGLDGHAEDLLYVIYAGGDDLFVVGSWHLLPLLAERVNTAFEQYVGGNPFLHISAGITLEGRKFPLYQAAKRAGQALEGGAKKHKYVENLQGAKEPLRLKKNAVHFLGQTVGWGEFGQVREKADRLARLVKEKDVPRGLLQTLQMIYSRFVADQKEAQRRGLKEEQTYYGPWMWRQAYYLKRFADDKPQEVQDEVKTVQDWTLTHRIQYLGLVARWAEYLTRRQEG